jgi:adenylate cyclase
VLDPAPIIDWLIQGAPNDPLALIDALVERLAAAGVRLVRLRLGLNTMHPEVAAVGPTWIRGLGSTRDPVTHRFVERARASGKQPIPQINDGIVDELHLPLDDANLAEYPVLAEMRARGHTDYFIQLLEFEKRRSFVAWSSDAPGGFSDGELAVLRAIRPFLCLRSELVSAYEVTHQLLQVYLGQNAARRVLAGAFRRGQGEQIRAVIWICDVRGFTTWVDGAPVGEVLPQLDAHFERVARPITDGGGEILKFIGDALLAIFPIGDDQSDACRRALAAADLALAAVAADGRLGMGIGLHLGDVVYGNIGASDRLDFTVIGGAVNEVSRVESLCKELEVPLLCTAAFARALGGAQLKSLGRHGLRGVAEPAELFTLARLR